MPRGAAALAPRSGQPYPAPFRIVCGPAGNRTRTASTPSRRHPFRPQAQSVESRGFEPRSPAREAGIFPFDDNPEDQCRNQNAERRMQSSECRTQNVSGFRKSRHRCPAFLRPFCILRSEFCLPKSDQGGSRTHKHQALDLTAIPVRVPSRQLRSPGLEPGSQAYETRPSTRPPASRRPGSRTQPPGL